MASTPALLRGESGLRILAGSDDRRLHAFDPNGGTTPGFPVRTD